MKNNELRILFIGDIYGRDGRRATENLVPKLRKEYNLDFVIANAENASNGKSLTEEHYLRLKQAGVDCFTMGNHTFYGGKLEKYLNRVNDILVPANYNEYNKYKGTEIFQVGDKKIRITCLLGQTFMFPIGSNPWKKLDDIIQSDNSDIHLVDFHAETTSEKIALGFAFDGLITAQVGTHTHVQTADERILPKGTGFISDLGMTGPYISIIGSEIAPIINRLKYGVLAKFKPAKSIYQFMGCVFFIDKTTNKVTNIKRINIIENEG